MTITKTVKLGGTATDITVGKVSVSTHSNGSCILETYSCVYSEREDRLTQYEQWQKMREVAIQNSDGKLPEGFEENFPQPLTC